MPTLHVTNGDCAADVLRSFLSDPVIIEADVLHEGPTPAVDDDAWLDQRARFLASSDGDYKRIRESLERSDRALAEADRYDQVVLWFEHDLFDQLQIVRTLSRLRRSPAVTARTRLICIDRFPGVEPFFGLGQLDARQLASLAGEGRPVTHEHFTTADHVWKAFQADDPSELNAIWTGTSRSLDSVEAFPFLRAAIGRFLAEYPSVGNGLSTTCQMALDALAPSPLEAGELFRHVQAREARPFMGDSIFFAALRKLATVRRPLVHVSPADDHNDLRGHQIALGDDGRAVLSGRLDAVAQNGIDEWRGGVHLLGRDRSPWCWDARGETLISWNQLLAS